MIGIHSFSLNISRVFFLMWVLCMNYPFSVAAYSKRKPANSIELNNNNVSIVISESAEFLSCVNRKSGINIASQNFGKIASIITTDNRRCIADKAVFDGKVIRISFESYYVDLEVSTFDDYISFEVIGGTLSHFKTLVFIDLNFDYDYTATNPFLVAGIGMTLQTDPVYYPSGEAKKVQGRCTSHTGLKGAKLALVACEKENLRFIIKKIYKTIPKGTIPININGGPFALDSRINKEDCVILDEVDSLQLGSLIDFYSQFGVRQFDFHQGPKSFIQGQFSFPTVGTAELFKKTISEPLLDVGIISSMHTYSHYISYDSDEILSNPKWQQQLEFIDSLVLLENITPTSQSLILKGDNSIFNKAIGFKSDQTPYILIDEEIIKYTHDSNGGLIFLRGQCGTEPSSHRTGANVKIIGGRFYHIAPQPCSELFYEIAHRTADVYNRGGFRGLYFDALEGLIIQLQHKGLEEFMWYYVAEFVNEVLKYCNEPPIVEYSSTFPTIWSARGRGGAWDTPNRGYKSFIDRHIQDNQKLQNYHYVTTLGWFDLYPKNVLSQTDYSTRPVFSDDIDYLGVKTIVFDQTMVYLGLKESNVNAIPALKRNLDLLTQYNMLRHANYFTRKVKDKLKGGEHEYKLIKRRGEWGFIEVEYNNQRMHDIVNDKFFGYNPFKRQKPFIRIENLYSSNCMSTISLIDFNEDKNGEYKSGKTFPKLIDLSNHNGIKITLEGKGGSSKDALCIRLLSSSYNGYADYIVPLNFEGWRDIILSSLDNGEYKEWIFDGMDDDCYNIYRRTIDFSQIKTIQLFKSKGCSVINIKSIDAVPIVSNTLDNPTIILGGVSVTFNDSVKSGEYIEYNAGDKEALLFDRLGKSRVITVKRNGKLKVPHGEFTATVSGNAELDDAPNGVTLTIGVKGDYVMN